MSDMTNAPDANRMSAWRDEVAGMLGEHHLDGDTSRQYDVAGQCTCGQKFYEIGGDPDSYLDAHLRLLAAHAAHLAQVLLPLLARIDREARADAWDEGYEAFAGQFVNPLRADGTRAAITNPYRSEAKP